MKSNRRMRLCGAALIVSLLAGCATHSMDRPLAAEQLQAIQPVQLQIGIANPNLYAAYVPSDIAGNAAAGCAAIPGLGILLAGVCGGAFAAAGAAINTSRFETAQQQAQPILQTFQDNRLSAVYSDAITDSLKRMPAMAFTSTSAGPSMDVKSLDKIYRASEAGSLLFLNVDYHIKADFSALEVVANGYIAPRSKKARTAAGYLPDMPDSPAIAGGRNESVYQLMLTYEGRLPPGDPAATIEDLVVRWTADNAKWMKLAIDDSVREISRLIREDLQRAPGTERVVIRSVDANNGQQAALIAKQHDSQLLRLPNGSLLFRKTLSLPTEAVAKAPTP